MSASPSVTTAGPGALRGGMGEREPRDPELGQFGDREREDEEHRQHEGELDERLRSIAFHRNAAASSLRRRLA